MDVMSFLTSFNWLAVTALFTNPTILALLESVVLVGGLVVGFRKGFAAEISGLAALICATVVFFLLNGMIASFAGREYYSTLTAVGQLILAVVLFSVFNMIFAVLRLASRLPVIHIVDKVLGIAAGFIKAVIILYIAKYLLRFLQ